MANLTQSNSDNSQKGQLLVVATPIGNFDDWSFRAVETLKKADIVFAEDTRHSQRLMQHYQITTPMQSLHEHNEQGRILQIAQMLDDGKKLALISDAGTPLISDPGFKLVRDLREQGYAITPVPGACAFVSALSIAGLATDSFTFVGFLPSKRQGRISQLEKFAEREETLVFYESSHRIEHFLKDCQEIYPQRLIVVARELTKTFETVMSGTAGELSEILAQDSNQARGEFVVMIDGATTKSEELTAETRQWLDLLAEELPPNKAAKMVSQISGIKKKVLYQYLLDREQD